MDLSTLFRNNENWVAKKLSLDPDYFRKLSEKQEPELLYIGCSDSRVTAEELMGVNPGEVFVHRNVANQVISTDNSVNAVVQFAVEKLNVKHIVVCGHYECGGIMAALDPNDMSHLNSWLQTLRDVYRIHREELDMIGDFRQRTDKLTELNVIEQCINIIKIDHVQRSWYEKGFPVVHGWVFDVRTGRLIDLDLNMQEVYREVSSIYDIKPLH